MVKMKSKPKNIFLNLLFIYSGVSLAALAIIICQILTLPPLIDFKNLRKATRFKKMIEQGPELSSAGAAAGADSGCGAVEYFIEGISAVLDGLFNDIAGDVVTEADDFFFLLAVTLIHLF